MTIQNRLNALVDLGYTVGVGATDDDGEAISYRISGFGIDVTAPLTDAAAFLDSIEGTHDERAAEDAKTPEERDAEVEAARTERQEQQDELVAKIQATDLPASVKGILEELAALRF